LFPCHRYCFFLVQETYGCYVFDRQLLSLRVFRNIYQNCFEIPLFHVSAIVFKSESSEIFIKIVIKIVLKFHCFHVTVVFLVPETLRLLCTLIYQQLLNLRVFQNTFVFIKRYIFFTYLAVVLLFLYCFKSVFVILFIWIPNCTYSVTNDLYAVSFILVYFSGIQLLLFFLFFLSCYRCFVFSGVHVAQSLVFCMIFCIIYPLVIIVKYVLIQFMASDYIVLKLFFSCCAIFSLAYLWLDVGYPVIKRGVLGSH